MQQLSLFDFGEQAPKPEKKKKASKDGSQQAGSIPVKESSADPSSEQSTPYHEEPSAPLEQDPALEQSNEQEQQQGQEQPAAIPTPPEQPLTATQDAETTLPQSQSQSQPQSQSHDEATWQTGTAGISEASEEDSVTTVSNVPTDQPQANQYPEQLPNQQPAQEAIAQPELNTDKAKENESSEGSDEINPVSEQSDTPQQNAVNATSDQDHIAQITNNAQSTFELTPPQQKEEIKAPDVVQENGEAKGINSDQEPANDYSKDVQDISTTSEASEDSPEASTEATIEVTKVNKADPEIESDVTSNESSTSLQDNNNNQDNNVLNAAGVENESAEPAEPKVPAEATDQPSAITQSAEMGKEQIQEQEQNLQGLNQVQGDNQPANSVVFANEQFGVKVVVKTVKAVSIESIKMPPPPVQKNPESLDNADDPIKKEDASPESEHKPDQSESEDAEQLTTSEKTQQAPEATFDTSFSPDDFSDHMEADAETSVSSATAKEEKKEVEEEEKEREKKEVTPLNNTGLPILPSVIENITDEEADSATDSSTAAEASDQKVEKADETTDNQSKEGLNEAQKPQNTDNNSAKKPYYIEDLTVPVRKRGRKSFKEIDAEVDLINVPPDEELFQKQYYPISVVAKWFRVNNSLLRFWENEFKILKPRKNKKGDRFFRPEDVKNLQLIYYLLRQKKLTINGAIKHLNSYREQTEVNLQLIQTLNEFKGFLLELRAATEK